MHTPLSSCNIMGIGFLLPRRTSNNGPACVTPREIKYMLWCAYRPINARGQSTGTWSVREVNNQFSRRRVFFRLDSAVRKRMRVSRDFSAVIRAAIVPWHFYFIVCLRKSMKRPTGSAGRRGRRLQLGFNSLGLLCLRLSLKEFCTFQLADEGSKSVIELKRCTAANCYYMHCAQFSRNQRKIITQNHNAKLAGRSATLTFRVWQS